MDGENIQIISKLEPIECEEAEEGVEVVHEIHVENTDGNMQINAFNEHAEIHNAGEYVTEDGTQKIIITEAGEAYISEDGNTSTIYVQEAGNYKTEYEIVDEVEHESGAEYEEAEEYVAEIMSNDDSQDVYTPTAQELEFAEDSDKLEENICTICDRSFKTSASLKRHISVTHGDEDEDPDADDPLAFEVCLCCGEPMDSAHINGTIPCKHCDKLFMLQTNLFRHNALEHPDDIGMYRCCECLRTFGSKQTIRNHMQSHPLAKPFSCKACNRDFTRKYHLDRHVMQTGCDGAPRNQYKCMVCNKTFGRKDNLRDHLRAHAGQIKKKKTFPCPHCGKEFQGHALLVVHMRTHTGEKPYACDLCPKRFPSSGAYKKHRRMHTGEKPYQCMQCKRRFAAKETLNRHVRTHTGVKPHSCSYCGKSFIQAAQLRAHIFHHTGENAFTCPHCNRAFNRRVRLTTHIKFVHEGAQPLECNLCDRTFFRKEDLLRHELLHSGEKPFECDTCKKRFAVKASLKLHMLTHRKEQPCACDECGRAFIRQDCLLRHMRAKHRDVLEDIMAAAEKKRLQEQLLAPANIKKEIMESRIWTELTLTDSIKELLNLLVDEKTLTAFGWPDAPVDKILDSVIRRCGHEPATNTEFDYISRMRENAKLLFTVVIDDQAVKSLLNNQTVDEVIQHVLRLAKSDNEEEDDDDEMEEGEEVHVMQEEEEEAAEEDEGEVQVEHIMGDDVEEVITGDTIETKIEHVEYETVEYLDEEAMIDETNAAVDAIE